MARFHRFTIGAGLLLIALSILFPPWTRTFQQPGMGAVERPIRSWRYTLFTPPPAPPIETFFRQRAGELPFYGIRVDFSRLALDWAMIGAFTLALSLLRRSSKSSRQSPSPGSSTGPKWPVA